MIYKEQCAEVISLFACVLVLVAEGIDTSRPEKHGMVQATVLAEAWHCLVADSRRAAFGVAPVQPTDHFAFEGRWREGDYEGSLQRRFANRQKSFTHCAIPAMPRKATHR